MYFFPDFEHVLSIPVYVHNFALSFFMIKTSKSTARHYINLQNLLKLNNKNSKMMLARFF